MPTSEKRPRILVVEDNAAVARVVVALLVREGFEVVNAATGTDAMALLDDHFDAMVVDLRLPGMRGDAVYFAATARQPWLTCRALFLTGDIEESAERIIAETGCRWMAKPFDIPRFIEAIRAMLPPSSASLGRVG